MSTLNTTLPGLQELAVMANPTGDGSLNVIRSMVERSDLCKDMPIYEANGRMFHKYVRNTALVSGTWVNLNDGISASKGGYISATASLGRLESRLIVDVRLADYERDFAGYVARLGQPHIDGLSNDMEDAVSSGTVSGGYAFPSIEEHIASATQTDQFGKYMCHTYGGTSTVASIIAVQWGQDMVYGVFPQGHKYAGVEKHEYSGDQLTSGVNSSDMRSYVCDFAWAMGLVIADDRCVRRICNIEPSAATNNMLGSSFKIRPVIDALVSMKDMGRGAVLYMNREVWGFFWKKASEDANVNYTPQGPWDQPRYVFDGHKIGFSDSLTNAESQVT